MHQLSHHGIGTLKQYQPSHYGIGTLNTIMGLLTWNLPSSQTKEADTIDSPIAPSIVSTNVCFWPREVNDKTLGFTWIFSPLGAVTIALYVDVGNPTFVTVLVKLPLTFGLERET